MARSVFFSLINALGICFLSFIRDKYHSSANNAYEYECTLDFVLKCIHNVSLLYWITY